MIANKTTATSNSAYTNKKAVERMCVDAPRIAEDCLNVEVALTVPGQVGAHAQSEVQCRFRIVSAWNLAVLAKTAERDQFAFWGEDGVVG